MTFKVFRWKLSITDLSFPIAKALQLFQTLSVFALIEHFFPAEELATYFVIVALGSIVSILDFGTMSTVVRFRHKITGERNLESFVVKTLISYFRNVILTSLGFFVISNFTNIDNRILSTHSELPSILIVLFLYMISQGPQFLAEKIDVSIQDGGQSAKWAIISILFVPISSLISLLFISNLIFFLSFLYLGLGILGLLHLIESIDKYNSKGVTSKIGNVTVSHNQFANELIKSNLASERKEKRFFAILQIFAYISNQLGIAMIAYFLSNTEVIQFGIISRIVTPLGVILNSTNLHLWSSLSGEIKTFDNRYSLSESIRIKLSRAFRNSFFLSLAFSLLIPLLVFIVYRFLSIDSEFPSWLLIFSSMVWLIICCVASVMDYALKGLGWISFTISLGFILFVISNVISIMMLMNGLESGPFLAQSLTNITAVCFFLIRVRSLAK